MGGHVRITFYVGLARRSDTQFMTADLADARAGAVARFFARAYPSGTFKRADGYWQGVAEPSATFEVIVPEEPAVRAHARDVAARLSVLHKQDGIGLAFDPVVFRIIGPDDLPSVFHGRYRDEGSTLESLDPATRELALNAGRVSGKAVMGDHAEEGTVHG